MPISMVDGLPGVISGVQAQIDSINSGKPQTIVKCKLASAVGSPYEDLVTPNFLSFSGQVVTLSADASNPFQVCAGDGPGKNRLSEELTSNLTWTIPTTNGSYYLAVDVAEDGTLSAAAPTSASPEYSNARRVGTGDVFLIAQNTMLNASNAKIHRVYVGYVGVVGGVLSALYMTHPGVTTIITPTPTGVVAQQMQYTMANPYYGCPVSLVTQIKGANWFDPNWVFNGARGVGAKSTIYNSTIIMLTGQPFGSVPTSTGAPEDGTTITAPYARIIVTRGF